MFLAKLVDFHPKVAEFWSGTEKLFHSTSALFRFSKKLKKLKPILRGLSREKLDHITTRTQAALDDLCAKQQANHISPSVINQHVEHEAYVSWERLSGIEEQYLKQKAKLHWLNVGDRNNKTFHRAVRAREAMNGIREIRNAGGIILRNQDEIKAGAVSYFTDFLNFESEEFVGIELSQVTELFDFRCSLSDKAALIKEVTSKEIKEVLFSMPNNKAPGPDGFTSEFYKEAWSIIEDDFVTAVQSFFRKGFLPTGINSTILAVIPKKTTAIEMRDYRPISCCNVIYKVISKILANRMKVLLPKFIAPNQSTFVKDRLLIENLLLATELVKDYHRDTISPRCAMQIDISKAFVTVQWDFLLTTLQGLDFPTEFIHWIRLCITTASFSVQVNGELAGYFRSKRGLRQGCSLSPYLFVICMNVLSKILDKAARDKVFGYHPQCQNLNLTHLCFADDLMVFSDGHMSSLEGIIGIFDRFSQLSGLRISLEKSTVFLAGISPLRRDTMMARFPFDAGTLPVRLGLPLLTKQMSPTDYKPLLEKIHMRFGSWSSRLLSYAGRLELISSVIESLLNFWMSAFRLPSGCIKEVEKLCASFLWSVCDLSSGKAKVAWSKVCRSKVEGGLGLKNLKESNQVCVMKLLWRIVSAKTSLWVNWVKEHLIREDSFWTVADSRGSWMWRKILKYRNVARGFVKCEVKNGYTTSFWHDTWCSLGPLHLLTGPRGCIDLGIPINATVSQAIAASRRRRCRGDLLRSIEVEIEIVRAKRSDTDDRVLWKMSDTIYKAKFITSQTLKQIRNSWPKVAWTRGIWFTNHTPKFAFITFAFITWLALHNRLSTGDQMAQWNTNVSTECVLCHNALETRDHLFFSCSYSHDVWHNLGQGIFQQSFSTNWADVVSSISEQGGDFIRTFLCRYLFQLVIYQIWYERNKRRHGDSHVPPSQLARLLDKMMRNRLSSIKQEGSTRFEEGLITWFSSRPHTPIGR